jgi:hypothetical protein
MMRSTHLLTSGEINLETITIRALEVLTGAKAAQATADHNANTATECFAFFHANAL